MKEYGWNIIFTDGNIEKGTLKSEDQESVLLFLEANKPENAIAITVVELSPKGDVNHQYIG